MLLAEAIQQVILEFSKSQLSDPKWEAQELVRELLNFSLTDLLLKQKKPLDSESVEKLFSAARQRAQGVPLAYVVGEVHFFKHRFVVNQHTLIPRSDTEILVAEALKLTQKQRIVDLGCGSGCIGLSLLKESPQSQLTAIDISEEALAVAQQNAKKLGVFSQVTWICANVTDVQTTGYADVVVANPPYIAQEDPRLDESVKKYEPAIALYAKDNGLQYFKQWSNWAQKVLVSGGSLIFEVGQGQAESVRHICLQNGFKNIKIIKDLKNIERVVLAEREAHG